MHFQDCHGQLQKNISARFRELYAYQKTVLFFLYLVFIMIDDWHF